MDIKKKASIGKVKLGILGLVGCIGILLLYVCVQPYWLMHQVQSAVSKGDSQALGQYMDYPRLRAHLKQQFQKVIDDEILKIGSNPFAILGDQAVEDMLMLNVAMSTQTGMLQVLFDAESQQPNFDLNTTLPKTAQFLQLMQQQFDTVTPLDAQQVQHFAFDYEMKRKGFDQIQVVILPKQQQNFDHTFGDWTLERQGLSWKVTGVNLVE